MAKIIQEDIVIKLSRLAKNSESDQGSLITDELVTTLESVAQELLGDSVVVEVNPEE